MTITTKWDHPANQTQVDAYLAFRAANPTPPNGVETYDSVSHTLDHDDTWQRVVDYKWICAMEDCYLAASDSLENLQEWVRTRRYSADDLSGVGIYPHASVIDLDTLGEDGAIPVREGYYPRRSKGKMTWITEDF